ncbi:MAG: tetratricopeptide repeat protein [Hyphomicrobiales bacterium]|nr:tetratricopeptide repeat protein [Hyphomicrobiales bacterium]MCP5372973.1 tetratricopeptide repeat protein [Hyphomicrobiales bacterium]
MEDHHGNPASGASARGLDAYDRALGQLNAYCGDMIATIDAALAEEPDFAMGHILRAEVFLTMWERSVIPEIEAALARLDDLGNRLNDRERAHTGALRAWAGGDWRGFQARLDRLLDEHPRDLLALQVGHLSDFYLGDRDNLRGRVARALPAWTGADRGYGYVLGMAAFGLEECGAYGEAEERGRHALALQPGDCWARHAVAHVLEMQARQAEGIAFMESGVADWAQPENLFAHHNWWHTALFHLDQGDTARALELYDARVRPTPEKMQVMALDGVSFLWRLHLRGLDVGDRWGELADTYADGNGPGGEAGFYAFNDMHAMMALIAAGRDAAAADRLAAVEAAAAGDGTNAGMVREVGLPIARAIQAFAAADYATAAALLLPVRYRAHAFGGSHAQRDMLDRTLIEAALRAGDGALARSLTGERVALKPHCPFSWSLRRRAEAA